MQGPFEQKFLPEIESQFAYFDAKIHSFLVYTIFTFSKQSTFMNLLTIYSIQVPCFDKLKIVHINFLKTQEGARHRRKPLGRRSEGSKP